MTAPAALARLAQLHQDLGLIAQIQPEHDVSGLALKVLVAVIEEADAAASARMDTQGDPILSDAKSYIANKGHGEPLSAVDALMIAGQFLVAIGKPVSVTQEAPAAVRLPSR